MMKLTANKSKFYALAKTMFPKIEPMHRTEFVKFNRVRDYRLIFREGKYYHRMYLTTGWGCILLADEWSYYQDNGDETKGRETQRLDLDTLRKYGMIEETLDLKKA